MAARSSSVLTHSIYLPICLPSHPLLLSRYPNKNCYNTNEWSARLPPPAAAIRHCRWVSILSQQVHYNTRIRPWNVRPAVRSDCRIRFYGLLYARLSSLPSFRLSFLLTLMMLKTEPGGRIDYSERKWENRRRRRPKLASQLHSALPESGQTSTTAAVSSPLLLRSPSPPSLAHALQSPLHLHGSINDASERAIEGGSCGSRDKLSS